MLLVYVDDLLIFAPDEASIAEVKTFLHDAFTIKDMGCARYFLGIELARSNKGLFLNQRKYTLDILQDVGLLHAKSTAYPMIKNLKLNADIGPPLSEPEKYRRLVGRLLYLNLTSLGITHVVQVLSQFLQQPRAPHRDVTVHLLKYLKGAPAKGLFFSSHKDCALKAYSDSD